jgi:CheY-like chemotaxis protein
LNSVPSDALSGLLILIVEDDADIRRMIATVLKGAGAQVTGAGNGRDALEAIGRETFDVIVVDWNLGDMPGGALLPRLVQSHPDLSAHILVVTGELMHTPHEHAAAQSGYAVLAKPFRPAALCRAISDLVS